MVTTRYNSFCISEACQFNCPRGNSCHDLHSKPKRMLILPVSIDCLKHCLSLELSLELAPRSFLPCQDVSQPRKSAGSAFEWSNNKREKEQASVQRLKSFSQEKEKETKRPCNQNCSQRSTDRREIKSGKRSDCNLASVCLQRLRRRRRRSEVHRNKTLLNACI